MLRAKDGGYDLLLGFVANSRKPVAALPAATAVPDESFRDDCRSAQPQPVVLPDHLANTAGAAQALCRRLGDPGPAVVRAARWQDLGKAHASFQGDRLPALVFDGEQCPETTLRPALMELGEGAQGPSWTARTQALLAAQGPFRLAGLGALVPIADWRATGKEQVSGGGQDA